MQKLIQTRIKHKHDTADNWALLTDFAPYEGEIIVYDPDSSVSYARFKVGDGSTLLQNLEFVNDRITDAQIDEICNLDMSFLDAIASEEVEF